MVNNWEKMNYLSIKLLYMWSCLTSVIIWVPVFYPYFSSHFLHKDDYSSSCHWGILVCYFRGGLVSLTTCFFLMFAPLTDKTTWWESSIRTWGVPGQQSRDWMVVKLGREITTLSSDSFTKDQGPYPSAETRETTVVGFFTTKYACLYFFNFSNTCFVFKWFSF